MRRNATFLGPRNMIKLIPGLVHHVSTILAPCCERTCFAHTNSWICNMSLELAWACNKDLPKKICAGITLISYAYTNFWAYFLCWGWIGWNWYGRAGIGIFGQAVLGSGFFGILGFNAKLVWLQKGLEIIWDFIFEYDI